MASNSTPLNPGFHYGGSLTAKGRIGSRPQAGRTFDKLASLEKLARLDVGMAATGMMIPDSDIARMFGRSVFSIQRWRSSSEFLRVRISIQTGVQIHTAGTLQEVKEFRKQYFKESLPSALKAIVDELERPAITIQERKLKVELAKDFLDREGTFPRISRTDSHVKIEHDYSAADSLADELLRNMDSPIQSTELDPRIQRLLNANEAFTTTENISMKQQEEGLALLETLNPISNTVN